MRLSNIRSGAVWLAWFALTVPAGAATLLHHWPFDEGAGSAVSDPVGSADMGISGVTTGWTAGKVGGAYRFAGSNYAVTTSKDAVASPGSAVAMAGWFKTSSTSSKMFLFQIETLFELRMNRGQFQLSFRGNAGTAPKWGEGLNDGLWHHFVAQNQGGVTELFIDGVRIGSRSESLSSLTSVSKYSAIGALQSGNSRFAGTVDDFRYYSGALTLEEIRVLAGIANIPPHAADDSYTGASDTALNVPAPGVLANDTEQDGDPMTAVLVSGVAQGDLTFHPDGSFEFVPPNGFSGVLTFTYLARDKDGDSAPATVTLTVLDPNTSITPAEAAQIESELGIAPLTLQEKLDLASIVKPKTTPAWRSDANLRIESHRKANLSLTVKDASGTVVSGATVRAKLKRHLFKFGGVVTVMDLTDASGNLAAAGSSTGDWQRITKALFNAVGVENGLKTKITSQHTYLPGFLSWAASQELPVRGHLLMWPGNGDLEDLDNPDAVPGVDYGDHLSNSSTSPYKSHNVLGAVETYKASARAQADKDALKAVVDAEIQQWVSLWNVYEWDVINETIGNILLQEILGYDQMAEWFKIADAHKVNPDCRLLINDYQLMSARFDAGSTLYQTRRDTYFSRIDQVIADGGPVDGIGFQSRFKFFEGYSPAAVYARLSEFSSRYPDMDFVGTEFEIPDWYDYYSGALVQAYDEMTRAQVTEEILTTYFSHPQVTAMNAWDYMNPVPDGTANAYSRALCYYGDGPGGTTGPIVKLNGLVWYYLHRIRYQTDTTVATDAGGLAVIRGFKGDYDLTVTYGGKEYPAAQTLAADGAITLVLEDVTVDPPLVPRTAEIEHWPFEDAAGVPLKDAANVAGTAAFSGEAASVATTGSGVLRVTQDPSKPTGGAFLGSLPLTIGPRTTGVYEVEFLISAASLGTGDASGASVGFGLKDSAAATDIFRVRLNKTTAGLAISTYIGTTYTTIKNFPGLTTLATPVKVRAVVDLDAHTADVFLTEGSNPELPKVTVPLSTTATTWDQMSFAASNNSADWGPSDSVEIADLTVRKLDLDSFQLWQRRVDWQGGNLAAGNDDPDQDGVRNFLEYALGKNPLAPDGDGGLPRVEMNGGLPGLAFTLGVDSADLEYWVQHSIDLIDWTSIPATRVHGPAGQAVWIPIPSAPKSFSRLSVNQP